jgi:aryl-alcohol dehydrogenase-like predicted oxidoreductase
VLRGVPRRPFGRHSDVKVSALGLGGHYLGEARKVETANRIVHEAENPSMHLAMLQRGYKFDSLQMPLNPFDASFRSFEKEVLPEVNKRGMAALGMKSLGGGQPILQGARSRSLRTRRCPAPAGRGSRRGCCPCR